MALIKGLNKVVANRKMFTTEAFLKSYAKTIGGFRFNPEPPAPIQLNLLVITVGILLGASKDYENAGDILAFNGGQIIKGCRMLLIGETPVRAVEH